MRIQVLHTFTASFQNVWNYMLEWFRVAYAPLVILVLGYLYCMGAYWYAGVPFNPFVLMKGDGNKIAEIYMDPHIRLGNAVYFITHFIFGVSLYINNIRYGVLQERGKSWFTLNLNGRFLKMVLYFILVGFLGGLYVLICGGILVALHFLGGSVAADIILGLIMLVYGFYILARISLYSLLIALDKPAPLRTSWALLKGNVLRLYSLYAFLIMGLFGIMILGLLILGVISYALSFINADLSLALLCMFIFFMGQFFYLAVMAKATSLVYVDLANNQVV